MTKTPITHFLSDYEAPAFSIDSIDLTFVLHETATTVTSVMTLRRVQGGNRPLVLNGENLILKRVVLDDQSLHDTQYELTNQTLTLHNMPESFCLEITNEINPLDNKSLDGLYMSDGIFCTQNEPEGFRRITYYLDRPDVMSLFTTKIIAKKEQYPVLLSNGNMIESGDLEEGYHFCVWEDPFVKPAYLYAVVAGNLGKVHDTFVTRSGRTIPLDIFCDIGHESKCTFAMQSLKEAMQWDEKRFDREYDLDMFMIVAVDSFNMGAMENKGLNIFNSHYVLASQETATDSDFMGIQSVIGHEYFHNWTGNRITCRDWFQLTLKEGLTVYRDQEFSSDLNDRVVQRISDVNMLRQRQFLEDASPTSHPIKPQEYIQINNFYTATVYEKGAEVIRMLATILGDTGFKKGMDLYFETFDGQAVRTEDFLWAMGNANDFDTTQFERWYTQKGTPVLEVKTLFDKGVFTLELEQCSTSKEPLLIPVDFALLDENANTLRVSDELFLLKEKKAILRFENLEKEPFLSINRNFSAPIILKQVIKAEQYAFLMAHDTDYFNRYEASQSFALGIMDELLQSDNLTLPANYIKAFEVLLKDTSVSNALKAKMITLPSVERVMQRQKSIDVQAICKVHDFVCTSLATQFEETLFSIVETLQQDDYTLDSMAMGKRALKNACLLLLGYGKTKAIAHYAKKIYDNATNMTDRFAMLALLSHIDTPERLQIQADFYQQFKDDTLVMNKYLAVLASSHLEGTLQTVITLQDDKIYDTIVPNLVRALVGTFARNMRYFHAKDGSGYAFIAEKIIAIDLFNPQIASGLAGAFKSYSNMQMQQKEQMKKSLQTILDVENISTNVFEIVSKILEG